MFIENNFSRNRSAVPRLRFGLTLIEVLIATTLTLLLMLALAQGYKSLSDGVSEGRSKINLSDQLRGIVTLLKNDLKLRTTDGSAPQSKESPKGYFKYLDGGLTDYSSVLANRPSSGSIDTLLNASKWGDIDDILMFTARAKPGEMFRGKIPRALLRFHEANVTNTALPSSLDWDEEWATDVVITSELAEIVWFMVPLSDIPGPGGVESGVLGPSDVWLDVVPVVDRNGDGIEDSDQMPDRIALCRRVLLIRDDLNITPPASYTQAANTADDRLFQMRPELPTIAAPTSFRNVCRNAYRRCDLSVTTEINNSSGTPNIYYRTNGLASLQDGQNRFAHGTYPVLDSSNNPVGTTLPLVFRSNAVGIGMGAYNFALSLASASAETVEADGGFIPSDFMRITYRKNTDGSAMGMNAANREYTLEEMIAPNVVGFDLRAFDSTAVQLYHPGPAYKDTSNNTYLWGTDGVDDDGDGTTDNVSEAGWPGSDDFTVTPNDPGFWQMLADSNLTPVEATRGAYVDIGWAFKGLSLQPMLSRSDKTAIQAFLVSDYSGIEGGLGLSYYMRKSGAFSYSPGVRVFQCGFDTFTDDYNSDGELISTVGFSRAYPNGLRRYGISAPTLGTDPADDDTSPPFPSRLSSIQAIIRVEDVPAGVIQQVSLVVDLNN